MRESGYSYNNRNRNRNGKSGRSFGNYDYVGMDDGLVIEDNTIYEIDLDCYECLQRQKRKLM